MEQTTCCRCLEPASISESTFLGATGPVALYWCGCQQPDAQNVDQRDEIEVLADLALRQFEQVPSYFERLKTDMHKTDALVEETDGYGQAEYEADDNSFGTAKWT